MICRESFWRDATNPCNEVVPEVLAGNDQPEDETFAAIMERFKYVEPTPKAPFMTMSRLSRVSSNKSKT